VGRDCDGPIDRPFLGPQLLTDPAFRSAFGPRVMSTTLAVAWVAAGRRAGYVSDGLFVENVHYAAGIALCRSAGCVVTDLAGQPLEDGRGLIIAANDETHQRLVDIIRPHLADVLSPNTEPGGAGRPVIDRAEGALAGGVRFGRRAVGGQDGRTRGRS
jgi:hypothetical protein